MSFQLQEGIYYRSKPKIGNSFCIVTLRSANSTVDEIGKVTYQFWKRLRQLKNGILADLNIDPKHRKTGNLSVLIGYGSKIFEIDGAKKTKPASFRDSWNFRSPNLEGGGVLIDGSQMKYSETISENHLLNDHILIQFIAENTFYTTRAAVELWKELHKWKKKEGNAPLHITGLYTGFQRQDQRNWQGFHDGISNLKSRERPYVISISTKYLQPSDKWTLNGTYLAFIRVATNLELWEDTKISDQEKIIGRDKLTGCPLVRVDKNGNPVKDARCPVPGTTEVIDQGNEYFREYHQSSVYPEDATLRHSHIRNVRSIDRVPVWDNKSSRIFRQGFEFLEPSKNYPGFLPGLNFVSFQNSPERLYKALTYQHMLKSKDFKIEQLSRFEQYFSVFVAGIFFVPPITKNEPFPGSSIFFDNRELRNLKLPK